MAQPTGTFATNDMVGIREDLADAVYDVSPTDTPFLTGASRAEATAVNHEWQTHELAAAADTAAIEGDDAPQDAGVATARLGNLTQITTKDARVTGTGQSVSTAGRADELDFQILNRGLEVRRNMETTLLSNKAKVVGNDSTARQLAGLPSWLATNTSAGSSGADPTGDGTDARTNGTQRAFAEADMRNVIRQCWDSGGMPDTLMVGSFNRQAATLFDSRAPVRQNAADGILHVTYDIYESEFGQLEIIPNRFQRARDALVLQMDMWAVAFLPGREFATFDIAKTGDSDAKQVLSEYTLEARNEKANGGVFDLTTA
jgi:hypothetical protein